MEFECPSSLVSSRIWSALELFWYCYQKAPGLNGWELHRTHLPVEGAIGDQDHWTLWAFRILEDTFYQVESEQGTRAPDQTHDQIKKKFGVK